MRQVATEIFDGITEFHQEGISERCPKQIVDLSVRQVVKVILKRSMVIPALFREEFPIFFERRRPFPSVTVKV